MSSTLKSDIILPTTKLDPKSIPEAVSKVNQKIFEGDNSQPNWWDLGISEYRAMRDKGQTAHPALVVIPTGKNITIPSRDASRSIPCRLFYPEPATSESASKGIILHFHGGGWVLGNENAQDRLLKAYADVSGCAAISVGYRLAPEHPFPAGPQDCYDVAEYLVDEGEKEFGGPLRFIGGESAGAHLSALVTFHLLRERPNFSFLGLLLHFGCYDFTIRRSSKPFPILSLPRIEKSEEAFLQDRTLEEKRDPTISPYYEDLSKWKGILPSALFTCGTVDILLEDTVLMGSKWLMNGGEAIIKIYPGAIHGFLKFPGDIYPPAKEGINDTLAYINQRMATIAYDVVI